MNRSINVTLTFDQVFDVAWALHCEADRNDRHADDFDASRDYTSDRRLALALIYDYPRIGDFFILSQSLDKHPFAPRLQLPQDSWLGFLWRQWRKRCLTCSFIRCHNFTPIPDFRRLGSPFSPGLPVRPFPLDRLVNL